jgi:hypothetical protein
MGAAVGYNRAQLLPFLRSLLSSGYCGEIILLGTSALASELAQDPEFSTVQVLQTNAWLPFQKRLPRTGLRRLLYWGWPVLQGWLRMRVLGGMRRSAAARRVGKQILPPSEARYLFYRDVLHASDYTHALLSDTRDVVFQQDPFSAWTEDGLYLSMEPPRYSLAGERWNSGWIRALYGESMLERIGHHPISCSGVTLGDRDSLLRYLDRMLGEMDAMRLPTLYQATTGLDQGMHNMLLRNEQLDPYRAMESLRSRVATLGGEPLDEIPRDTHGWVCNRDGSRPPVVHQHDRHEPLLTDLHRLLGVD